MMYTGILDRLEEIFNKELKETFENYQILSQEQNDGEPWISLLGV